MSLAPAENPTRPYLSLGPVQRRRKLALAVASVLAILALPFVASSVEEGVAHELLEMVGVVAIALAVVGRSWCTLYIGGRKAIELVVTGPYSVSRNPLYLFSFIGIAGIAAQTGSFAVVAILLAIAFAIFLPVILREEQALSARFGEVYRAYCHRVPRFGPKPSAWTDMETVAVSPRLFWRTAREGLLFFLVIPLCELIEGLQAAGYITPLVHLP